MTHQADGLKLLAIMRISSACQSRLFRRLKDPDSGITRDTEDSRGMLPVFLKESEIANTKRNQNETKAPDWCSLSFVADELAGQEPQANIQEKQLLRNCLYCEASQCTAPGHLVANSTNSL